MPAAMTSSSFPFIVQAGPKVPKEARTQIRKQAMKDIGIARKKRGTYGRSNMRQMPSKGSAEGINIPIWTMVEAVSSSSSDSRASSKTPTSSSSGTLPSDTDLLADCDEILPIGCNDEWLMARSGGEQGMSSMLMLSTMSTHPQYERARSTFGIDLMSLSILTNFNVGRSTIAILAADPTRLASLLGEQQWSYLEYVPGRYGTSQCLTAAADCLLAKVRAALAPQDKGHALCDRLYGRALRSLQDAIASDTSAMDADVLCATQLLSLHELLDPTRDAAWSHHVQGSARLVKHRSPARFQTEFEKALFAAHVGGTLSESLMNNTHCYLEQPEWTDLYTSLIQETNFLTDRSSLTIQCRATMFPIPGIWHDIDKAVNSDGILSTTHLASLEARCRKSHDNLLAWLEQYKAHCVRLSLAQPPASELSLRRELFGATMECLCIVKRLLATVCEADRKSLEVETQALAHLILDLQKQPTPKHSWLFSGHEVGVAYSVLLTGEQWEQDHREIVQATRTRYNTWSNTLRLT